MVDYSPTFINTILGTTPYDNSMLNNFSVHLGKKDLDDILATLTIPRADWYFEGNIRHIKVKDLTAEANVWAQFVKHTLFPTSHNSKLSIDRILVLYCILKGYQFDVGKLISANIKLSCTRINGRLFYPAIIHKLMAASHVLILPTDIFSKEKMTIGKTLLGKLLPSYLPADDKNASLEKSISASLEPTPNKVRALKEQLLANSHSQMQDVRELFRMHQNNQRQLSWVTRVLFEFRAYDTHRDRVWRDTVRILNRDLLYGLPSYPTLPPLEPILHPPTHQQ